MIFSRNIYNHTVLYILQTSKTKYKICLNSKLLTLHIKTEMDSLELINDLRYLFNILILSYTYYF